MINFKDSIFGKIPNTWSILEAENYCLKVTDGTHDSPKQTTIGYPLITSRHIKGSEIDFDNAYLISKEDYDSINKRSYVSQWDVIISMIGEYCGFTYLEENSDINYAIKNVGLFKTEDELKGKWLYYFFQSKSVNHLLNTYRSGTSQPYLALGTLRKFPILIPQNNQEIQQVVSILDSLRKKIDNLRAQNDTLEKTAQTLFTEWFGKYQVEDELPEGWRAGKLFDILEIKYGKDHKHLKDGDYPLYGSGGIMRYVEKPLYEKESILIPRKGTLSNLFYLNQPFWSVDTMFYSKIKNSFQGRYIFLFLKSLDLAAMNVGSAVPSLTTNVLNQIPIIIPENNIMIKFNNLIGSFYSKINFNISQIQTLTQTRDTLLPKLMSGQLRVKNIETLEIVKK